MTMKAFRIHGKELKLETIEIPEPNETQILVKVTAVSLNYRDKAILDGLYGDFAMIPDKLIPVNDTCGKIVKMGSKVKEFKIGDRVVNQFSSHWLDGKPKKDELNYSYGGPLNGGLAEYFLVEESACLKPPEIYTDEECSTLSAAALVAWQSLIVLGNLKSIDTVLIQGTGGVSIFALQITHAYGAKSIVLTSSNEKIDRVKKLGATHVIDYTKGESWDKQVMKLTNGLGVDHVVNVVGGDSISKSISITSPQGNIYSIGFLQGLKCEIDVGNLILNQVHLHGVSVGSKETFKQMIKKFNELNIYPVIDTVYHFYDSIHAYLHLGKGAFGKIVIKMDK